MSSFRTQLLLLFFLISGLLIVGRLYYWQILSAGKLQAMAKEQHLVKMEIPAPRGEIYTSDHFPLVLNQTNYLLYANLPQLSLSPQETSEKLSLILANDVENATNAAQIKEKKQEIREQIFENLNQNLVWVALKHRLSSSMKKEIENLQIKGLGFEEESSRSYPEASLAAHLVGFLGQDYDGQDKGYFGLEGYYDLELKGQIGASYQEKDVLGQPILVGDFYERQPKSGRDLILSLDRAVQFLAEKKLATALSKYGALSGSVIIIKPDGAVLAMASLPSYKPTDYTSYAKEDFINPVIAGSFEPGSVFKPLVMAAAINEGVVQPDSRCDHCFGPRQIGEYSLKTWNEKYYSDSTMTEILEHSDNVGMVFVAEKLGQKLFLSYLEKFGLGRLTGIDLQDEATPALRPEGEWKEIDLATAAFGQGIAVTPIQLISAINVIANDGNLVKPRMVDKVIDQNKEIVIKPQIVGKVIKSETAQKIKEMMVAAAESGEAKWTKIKGFRIAGKTGTAQIPVAGHYDDKKTIASFVGFAPADKPVFVMLVTLREPKSSPWASETAAPLWFDLCRDLLYHFKVTPQ